MRNASRPTTASQGQRLNTVTPFGLHGGVAPIKQPNRKYCAGTGICRTRTIFLKKPGRAHAKETIIYGIENRPVLLRCNDAKQMP